MRPILAASVVLGAIMQGTPASVASGATKVLENDRVIVWNVDGDKTPRAARHEHRLEALEVSVAGAVQLVRQGAVHAGPIGRTFTIELKPAMPQPPPAVSDLARPFPRQDASKLLESERVIVWDVRWVPERPVPAHTHDRDVISITIEPGELKFTADDGQIRIAPQLVGAVVYVPRGNSHREESVKSTPRAIIVELK